MDCIKTFMLEQFTSSHGSVFSVIIRAPIGSVPRLTARQHLRSTTWRFLVVPRCRLSTLGPHAFSVAG